MEINDHERSSHQQPGGTPCTARDFLHPEGNEFKSSIWIEKDERRVNAKSLLGVLSLGIVKGTTVTLVADGADEQEAIDTLTALINSDFSE